MKVPTGLTLKLKLAMSKPPLLFPAGTQEEKVMSVVSRIYWTQLSDLAASVARPDLKPFAGSSPKISISHVADCDCSSWNINI